jgi:hypothetical protein
MARFLAYEKVIIEHEENLVKSTFRNRCEIAGAGGRLALSIPLAGGRDHHQKYSATQIAPLSPWLSAHWRGITAAYGSSPFFDFYKDKFAPFYSRRFELLFDFNLEILHSILQILKVNKPFSFTTYYQPSPADTLDFRSQRRTSLEVSTYQPRYYQVFEDRTGFIPNLSVIDLIFNEGPQALNYLQKCAQSMQGK